MLNFIVRILLSALTCYVLAFILDGVKIEGVFTPIIFAIVLAFLNAVVKPILVFLTFPITIVTLGLFLFVINASIILLATKLIKGIEVDGFWWALLYSITISIFASATEKALGDDKKK